MPGHLPDDDFFTVGSSYDGLATRSQDPRSRLPLVQSNGIPKPAAAAAAASRDTSDSISMTTYAIPSPPHQEMASQRSQSHSPVGNGGLVGSLNALCPLPESALPSPVKAGRNLRLPSFEAMGIAAPHPDRMKQKHPNISAPLGLGSLPIRDGPLHPLHRPLGEGAQVSGTINWGVFTEHAATSERPADPESAGGERSDQGEPPSSSGFAAPTQSHARTPAFLEGIIDTISSRFEYPAQPNGETRVLSHALPCVSTDGQIFPLIISSISAQAPEGTTCWINVFHAIPGHFQLSNLPASAPSTPGPAFGGEDYVSSKVFDSAVQVQDYGSETTVRRGSPRSVVPPSSVTVSIVERYIPPATTKELEKLFTIAGPSLLVDRISELSCNNGHLIFLYPTKTGGRTFVNDYLSPVLAPVLRSIAGANGLSLGDLGGGIGTMAAVDSLLEFEQSRSRLEQFLAEINGTRNGQNIFAERQGTLALVYAKKEEIILCRKSWAEDWWVPQQKARIREVVGHVLNNSRQYFTQGFAAVLFDEIVKATMNRPYPGGGEPRAGVEVSVFIISRTA